MFIKFLFVIYLFVLYNIGEYLFNNIWFLIFYSSMISSILYYYIYALAKAQDYLTLLHYELKGQIKS